ncbi:hypothetical protein GQ457_13G008090 [Hibiscus cannabinus]
MEHVREADEEAVLKSPKALSPYMNFYVTQCKGMKLEGGKRKMDNNARKALGLRWAKMSDEEKKRYIEMTEEQKQAEAEWISKCEVEEVVKKEEEKSSRCSLKKLSNIFKEMEKVKIENVVKELGFSPLIGISPRVIHRDLCRELAEKFDVECSMIEYSGHKISVMVEDVQAVLGLKNEGHDVEEGTRKYDGKELAKKHKINTNTTYEQLEREILCGGFEGDELKAHVLLYVVGVFLCPNANRVPFVEHFKLLCSAGLRGKLNWCKYAYERLIDGISKLQNRVELAYMTECIAILEVRLFDYWTGIPSRVYAAFDSRARIHAWGKKDVAKIVSNLKGERPGKKIKVSRVKHFVFYSGCIAMKWINADFVQVVGSDEECSEGKECGMTNGGDDVIMEMLEKVITELDGIKESLEARVKKDNKIENTLETLKEESKKVVNQVVGLSANMMFMKMALRVIDAKFSIGLEEGEVMMEKTDFEQSNREYEANIVDEALKGDVILLKEEKFGVGGKRKATSKVSEKGNPVLTYVDIPEALWVLTEATCDYIWNTPVREGEIVLDFGHTYMSVADADTLRSDSWVGSMVIDAVGWTIIVEDSRMECKEKRGYLPCALSDHLVQWLLDGARIVEYWRFNFKPYGTITDWKSIFIPINDTGCHWYMYVLDFDCGEAKILDSLPTTRGNVVRVAVVKKLIKTLGECFHDEKFVQVFGSPSRPLTDLKVVVAKVKHLDNGYFVVKLLMSYLANKFFRWMQLWHSKRVEAMNIGDWDRMLVLYDLVSHDRNMVRRKISDDVKAHIVQRQAREFVNRASICRQKW